MNCKQVALLLNRIKNQELIEFMREDDVTLFEGKTIMGDRRGVYFQEKEKQKLESKEKKKTPRARAVITGVQNKLFTLDMAFSLTRTFTYGMHRRRLQLIGRFNTLR